MQINQAQVQVYKNKLNYETDSWDVYDALEQNRSIVVIDARSNIAYKKEHIPQAINLPHREINKETTKNFDKTALYVSYCDGIGCNASTKAALNMAKLGFRVKELMGGLDWWKRDGYKTEGENGQEAKTAIACAC